MSLSGANKIEREDLIKAIEAAQALKDKYSAEKVQDDPNCYLTDVSKLIPLLAEVYINNEKEYAELRADLGVIKMKLDFHTQALKNVETVKTEEKQDTRKRKWRQSV